MRILIKPNRTLYMLRYTNDCDKKLHPTTIFSNIIKSLFSVFQALLRKAMESQENHSFANRLQNSLKDTVTF